MFYGKFVKEKEELDTVNDIVRRVFDEELGIGSDDDEDMFALSLIALDGEDPVGTGRLVFDGMRFAISDIAVLPEHRGEGYGEFLLRLLIEKAVETGAYELRLDALEGTEDFFGRIGFEPEGTAFEKNGGRWQSMIFVTGPTYGCQTCEEIKDEED